MSASVIASGVAVMEGNAYRPRNSRSRPVRSISGIPGAARTPMCQAPPWVMSASISRPNPARPISMAVKRGEQGDELAEGPPGLGEPVDQQDRVSGGPCGDVVQGRSVDVGAVVGDPRHGGTGWCGGHVSPQLDSLAV